MYLSNKNIVLLITMNKLNKNLYIYFSLDLGYNYTLNLLVYHSFCKVKHFLAPKNFTFLKSFIGYNVLKQLWDIALNLHQS